MRSWHKAVIPLFVYGVACYGVFVSVYTLLAESPRKESGSCMSPASWNMPTLPHFSAADRYAVFIPTFAGHFALVVQFFQSIRCLCVDHHEIDFKIVVSDAGEADALRKLLDDSKPCGQTFGRWDVPKPNRQRPVTSIDIVNMYDILPKTLLTSELTRNDTSELLKKHGKFGYQSIKKLAAAIHFNYDFALWLDSESVAVRPFSFRETFEAYTKAPTIWRSMRTSTDFERSIMENSAKVLGRSIASFGPDAWTLESTQWIIDKRVVSDMVLCVEGAHERDFWSVWAESGAPFEITMYNLHIIARKLEIVDTLFSRYRVLESEREMRQYGLGPAFSGVEKGGGFLERVWYFLRKADSQKDLSAFLRRYGQRLVRLDDINVAPPDVIHRFLLDTPIDLIVSGAPPLHDWWVKHPDNYT
ncbi:glutathione-S-transferase theta, GST [Purpureocillium lavendulum]|uniref:Glutathione-S-transferase theta, GST n=1 Tax=Purpureocillium lavendulum TaxID=1247861 RepID=A0AB34FUZ0_9HYPO|nr:glutathione-S-transferase theta, GST [Purpureocillium lavendulum]